MIDQTLEVWKPRVHRNSGAAKEDETLCLVRGQHVEGNFGTIFEQS